MKKVVDDVPPIFTTVHIKEHNTSFLLSSLKNMLSFQFFELYISSQHLDIIIWHININTKLYNISMIFLSFCLFSIFFSNSLFYCSFFFFSLILRESQIWIMFKNNNILNKTVSNIAQWPNANMYIVIIKLLLKVEHKFNFLIK